jgi:hypothetical protein
MAVGTSTTLANSWLNVIRGGAAGTTYTAPSAIYVQLHTANPGSSGSTSVSSVTTRQAATFSASTTGVLSLSNTPSYTSWAGTNGEVVSHVSFWDASSAGNFLWSAALTASKTLSTGDTLNLSSASLTITTAS